MKQASTKTFVGSGIGIFFILPILVLAPFLFGCQRMVEKENMDAVAQWSIAMCKCAEIGDPVEAKSCADKLKQPSLQLLNSSGRTQYKLQSVQAYTEIESTGVACQAKIMAR